MTRTNDPRHDTEESAPDRDRYASFSTGTGFVLYDTENEAAWIASDTTCDPEELA